MINRKLVDLLLRTLHRTIADTTQRTMEALESKESPDPCYPPQAKLTAQERNALQDLQLSPPQRSAMAKIIRSSLSTPLFNFFCIMDGVADPDGVREWYGADFCSPSQGHREMLHDQFYESYWDYDDTGGESEADDM